MGNKLAILPLLIVLLNTAYFLLYTLMVRSREAEVAIVLHSDSKLLRFKP